MSRVALCVVALGTGLLSPVLAAAQDSERIEVSVSGFAASAQSRVFYGNTLEAVAGPMLGGAVGVRVGRMSGLVTGLRGTLSPIVNTPFARDVGQVEVDLRFEPRSWLGVEALYSTRAFRSGPLYQRWNTLGAGVRLAVVLGDPAVRAFVGASYLPFVSASVAESVKHGLGTVAGVSADVDRFTIALNYHFQRYDFEGGASARLEEFDWIGLQVAYRIPWRGKAQKRDTQ